MIHIKCQHSTTCEWLCFGLFKGASLEALLFHYSGHGSPQRNYFGDEVDGYDESLCPWDFETQGMIVDDEINTSIVKSLPRGVRLHAIIDACHSGTVLDLPFIYRMNRSGQYAWEWRLGSRETRELGLTLNNHSCLWVLQRQQLQEESHIPCCIDT